MDGEDRGGRKEVKEEKSKEREVKKGGRKRRRRRIKTLHSCREKETF